MTEFSVREQSGSWGRRGREPLSLKLTMLSIIPKAKDRLGESFRRIAVSQALR